jgi:hypothetical protein
MKENRYKKLFDNANPDPSIKKKIEESLHMVNFKIEVGTEEKHIVEFIFNHLWFHVEIKVDGQLYKQKTFLWLGQTTTFNISVGSNEIHNVRIELVRSIFLMGSRSEFTAWVFVDDEKHSEYSGKLSLKDKLFAGINRRTKTILIILMTTFIILFSALAVYNLPVKINKEIEGILFREGTSEPEYSESMTIVIDGEYHRKFFRDAYFIGKMYIEELHPEWGIGTRKQLIGLLFRNGGPADLTYDKFSFATYSEIIHVGLVYMKPNASEILIIVTETDKQGEVIDTDVENMLYFVAPCKTREEAILIADDLYKRIWGKSAIPLE